MPEARKQASVRRAVRERAGGHCEYCLSPDDCSSAPFTIEHIVPRVEGGLDTLENLAWACGGCNGSKGTVSSALDPETEVVVSLFHPRLDRWEDHFVWGEPVFVLLGKTAIGRATILRLNLNRAELQSLRRLLALAERHPPSR